MPFSTGIAVMAKAPRPGHAKTRLCSALSAEDAAALGAAFLGDVTENLRHAAQSAAIAPYIAYAPAEARSLFDGLVAPGTGLVLADGSLPAPPGVEGFGRCLLHAVHALFAAGHDAACVLNADSPNLPTRLLLQLHALLSAPGDRAVLGPAEDGGYYVLGVKRPHAALFAEIDWSTDRVAAQTRNRAAATGIDLIELEPWYDVDEPDTLRRLIRDLADPPDRAVPFAAPNTRARLQSLHLLPGEPVLAGAAA